MTKYILEKKRWIMLFLFCCVRFIQNIIAMTYSPIMTFMEKTYNQNEFVISTLSSSWMITFIVFAPIVAWSLDHVGLRYAMIISSLTGSSGSIMRYIGGITGYFWVIWTGQLITAVGQSFTFQSAPVISMYWFGSNERTIATALAFLSGIIGEMVPYVSSTFIVKNINDLNLWHMSQMCFAVLVSHLVVLFFKGGPITAPSASFTDIQHVEDTHISPKGNEVIMEEQPVPPKRQSQTLWRSLKKCVVGKSLILLWVGLTIETAIYTTMCIYVQPLLLKMGYDQMQGCITGAIMMSSSIISTIIVAIIVDRFKYYKLVLVTAGILTFTSLIGLMILTFKNHLIVPIIIICGLICIPSLIVSVIGMEVAIEFTYPMPEFHVMSIMTVTGCLPAIGILFIFEAIKTPLWEMVYMIILSLVGVLCLVFIPRRYNRLKYELKKNTVKEVIPMTELNQNSSKNKSDERSSIDDLGEKSSVGDLGEKSSVGDLGEKSSVDDLGIKLSVIDNDVN